MPVNKRELFNTYLLPAAIVVGYTVKLSKYLRQKLAPWLCRRGIHGPKWKVHAHKTGWAKFTCETCGHVRHGHWYRSGNVPNEVTIK